MAEAIKQSQDGAIRVLLRRAVQSLEILVNDGERLPDPGEGSETNELSALDHPD